MPIWHPSLLLSRWSWTNLPEKDGSRREAPSFFRRYAFSARRKARDKKLVASPRGEAEIFLATRPLRAEKGICQLSRRLLRAERARDKNSTVSSQGRSSMGNRAAPSPRGEAVRALATRPSPQGEATRRAAQRMRVAEKASHFCQRPLVPGEKALSDGFPAISRRRCRGSARNRTNFRRRTNISRDFRRLPTIRRLTRTADDGGRERLLGAGRRRQWLLIPIRNK